MRKHGGKVGKADVGKPGEPVPALVDPSMLTIQPEGGGAAPAPGSVIRPSISPSSTESDGQSSSLPGLVSVPPGGDMITDEPIPPPSPFDQPSTSKEFPIPKVSSSGLGPPLSLPRSTMASGLVGQ